MSTQYPALSRQTCYARALRAKLIEQLGGRCTLCPSADPEVLEFDHIRGRSYNPNQLSYSSRMKRYEREAEAGLLRLLCGPCNKAQRATNDSGQWIRTEHASLVPLTENLPF